jgi:branched-chain amino acid transport system substrate-binding protein
LVEEQLSKISGAEVVGFVEIETGTLDVGSAAVQALSYGADAYYLNLRADEAGKILNEMRTRGVDSGEKFCATFSAFGQGLLDICGENANGLYIWNKLDINYQGTQWQELVAAYTPNFNEAPSQPTVPGFYNAILAFKECVEELNLTGAPEKLQAERDAIANWIYNSREIEGIQGSFKWVNGQMMIDPFLYQVQDGAYISVR